MNARASGAALFAAAFAAAPGPGHAGIDLWDGAASVGGNLRSTTAATRNYEAPLLFGPDNRADGVEDLTLRLVAEGRPKDFLAFEIHGVQRLFISTAPVAGLAPSGLFGTATGEGPYRAWPLAWNWVDESDLRATLLLDRANLRLSFGRIDATIGRQAVSLGKAYFWNPLDVFLPFGPTTFDRDYKAGVDAARIDAALGDFSGITLLAVLGGGGDIPGVVPQGRWFESALLARGYTTVNGWDLAASAGKVRGGFQIGGAAAGELGPLALRGELAFFLAAEDAPLDHHLSAVAGLGHRFESGLDVQAEYYWNGGARAGARPAQLALLASGWLLHTSPHLLGLTLSHELHPLVRGSLAVIVASDEPSAVLQPGLVYSAADNVELVGGFLLGLGKQPAVDALGGLTIPSEFGLYPDVFYLQMKTYF